MVVQGIIRPPPEIRAVADRTALYVAKNGRTFESRILNSSKGQTPKFAFLHATSPFHSYYEDRILFYEQNGDVEEEKTDSAAVPASALENPTSETANTAVEEDNRSKSQKASALDPIAKALLSQRTRIAEFYKQNGESVPAPNESQPPAVEGEESAPHPTRTAILPPPPNLSLVQIVAPASISALQLETIQFTAQLIALCSVYGRGVNLLQELTMREWNNRTFAFCQPRHGHFAYFSALVDAYQRILYQWSSPPSVSAEKPAGSIEAMASNVDHCLEIAAYRAEYQRDQEERSQREQDGPTVAKIDWHDFVVVETIDFPVDEVVAMVPPPMPPSIAPAQSVKPPQSARNDSDMEEEDDEEETIRVVPTYTPKIATSDGASSLDTMVVDPISGKSVAVKDMPEHMRIQLLDPKWAEERKKFQDKQKESNLVSGDIVAANLERFAQARGDRFGKKVRERSNESYSYLKILKILFLSLQEQDLLAQEAETKKRLEEANRIIREQVDSQRAVGPAPPGQVPLNTIPLPPPVVDGSAMTEPTAKRPKIVTYAPSVLQQPSATTATTIANPPIPPIIEDPFAVAGVQPLSVGASTLQSLENQDLIPEAEFAASLSKPEMVIQIRVPNDPTQMAWNFYGQIVSLSTNVMAHVKIVKSELASLHLNGIPTNKIQLKNPTTGAFLRDNVTLAAHNIGPSTTLELVPRARGGKKK